MTTASCNKYEPYIDNSPQLAIDIRQVNDLIDEHAYRLKFKSVLFAGLGIGSLSACAIIAKVTVSTAILGGLLMTISAVALMVLGLGVGLAILYRLYLEAQEINEQIRQNIPTNIHEYTLQQTEFWEDKKLTKEERTRIGPFCYAQEHEFKERIRVDYKVTFTHGGATLFSATPFVIKASTIGNHYEEDVKPYKSWRELLCQLTLPENTAQLNSDFLMIVGSFAFHEGYKFREHCMLGDYWFVRYPKVLIKVFDQDKKFVQEITTPEQCLQFLQERLNFYPVSA